MKRNFKNIALLILVIVVMFFIFRNPFFFSPETQEISFDQFIASIEAGEVNTAEPLLIKGDDKVIEGSLTDGTAFEVSYLVLTIKLLHVH